MRLTLQRDMEHPQVNREVLIFAGEKKKAGENIS
jgi:hypothetical protein